jgi:hypothetical protein
MADSPDRTYSQDGRWLWDGAGWVEASGSRHRIRRPPVWSAAVFAAAMLLIVCGVFFITIRSGVHSGINLNHGQTTGLHELRVCNSANYDSNTLSCLHNQADSIGTTTAIYCSAVAVGSVGERLSATLDYNDSAVRKYFRTLTLKTTALVLSFAISPNDPLPGGHWSCQYSASADNAKLNFDLQGPSSSFLYPRACSGSDVQSFGAGQICTDSENTLASSSPAYCGAVISDMHNTRVSLVVAYGGGSQEPITKTYELSSAGSVFVAGAYLQPDDFGSGSSLPSGTYNCGWIAGGRLLGSTTFQVA